MYRSKVLEYPKFLNFLLKVMQFNFVLFSLGSSGIAWIYVLGHYLAVG